MGFYDSANKASRTVILGNCDLVEIGGGGIIDFIRGSKVILSRGLL